jgi:PKD repeat protein
MLRVTDDKGLQASDTQQITVLSPPDPPEAYLSVDPTGGSIPLTVDMTASATGGGAVAAYRWDVDGDGAYDISTTNGHLTYTYTDAGLYQASVTVLDESGLTDCAAVTVTAAPAQTLRVWISTPRDGEILWGQRVSLRANTAPGHLTQAVRFEYKRTDESTWTVLGAYQYAPAHSFSTNWDVTALSDGSNYNLRVRAMDIYSNQVTSAAITVQVDSGGTTNIGAIVETLVGGKPQKQQVFSKDEKTAVAVDDGTEVIIAAGTVDSNTTVKVLLTGQNTNAPGGSAAGKAAVDANRHVSLQGDPQINKPINITIPYPDADNDGIVDGSGIPETTLSAHWFDTVSGQWRRALSTEVHTEENYLTATTYHLTEFGLFGSRNLLHPANGSVLDLYTSEDSEMLGVENLTDDNTVSYWRSETNPSTPQQMVYSFKDNESALLTGAGIYNHGEGSEGYSRSFAIQGSINGSDYSTLTDGVLAATGDIQVFDFGTVTCRTVRLIISNGIATDGFELAEFELYGDTTPDADSDTLTDAWEVQYFGDLVSNCATNDVDNDGLDNEGEQREGTNPNTADSDSDGMNDGDEVTAGTSATNVNSCFVIADFSVTGSGSPTLLQNPGFEIGWNPVDNVPYWYYDNPLGTAAGAWGDVGISNGPVHSGTNMAYIRNATDSDETGGFWQQITNEYAAGTVWEAGAWVYSDDGYTNRQCELKIEFLNESLDYLYTSWHIFDAPGSVWTQVSGTATAPVDAVYIRFVMASVGQGSSGAFHLDHCYLAPYAAGDWIVQWNSVTGRTYSIHYTTDLGQSGSVVHETVGTGAPMAYTNRVQGDANGFMRVSVERE